LFHEVTLLIEDLLDSFVDSILHFLGLYRLVLFIILHNLLVVLNLFLLLLEFELI